MTKQCAQCNRNLPAIPFIGIGWRDVILDPKSKYRTRICNECYAKWRKTHPVKKRTLNIKFINNIISLLMLVLAVYALLSFMDYGIGNWTGFLAGPGLVVIVGFIFLNLSYGLLNKKIEFVPPAKSEQKKKWEFNFPNIATQQPTFRQAQQKQMPTIPTTLTYSHCDVCGLEKVDDELFTHPDGFKICSDCIRRQK